MSKSSPATKPLKVPAFVIQHGNLPPGGALPLFPLPRLRGKVHHHLCREESPEMAAGVNAQVVRRMGGKHVASPKHIEMFAPTLTLPRTRGRGYVEMLAPTLTLPRTRGRGYVEMLAPTLTLPRTRGRGCVEIFARHEAVESSSIRHSTRKPAARRRASIVSLPPPAGEGAPPSAANQSRNAVMPAIPCAPAAIAMSSSS